MTTLVAGLGAAGSAALLHLARAGERAIGMDPWQPPHARGSTHGPSRIHRRAYMEGSIYLPLLERAESLWISLQEESGRLLLRRMGALMLGSPSGRLLSGSLATAGEAGIPVESLSRGDLLRRFPELTPPPGSEGLLEPGAGALDPSACVEVQLAAAVRAGAELRIGEGILGWEETPGGLEVRTSRGRLRAERLILATGAWTPGLLARSVGFGVVPFSLEVERQVTGRFGTRSGVPVPPGPVLLVDRGDEPLLYAIPETDGTLKAGLHHGGDRAGSPAALRKDVLQDDEVRIAAPLGALLPGIAPRWLDGTTCLYTNTPDGRWLVGPLPGAPRVILVSACSGHGFKVSPAVGEAAAALALDREPPVDLRPFHPAAVP